MMSRSAGCPAMCPNCCSGQIKAAMIQGKWVQIQSSTSRTEQNGNPHLDIQRPSYDSAGAQKSRVNEVDPVKSKKKTRRGQRSSAAKNKANKESRCAHFQVQWESSCEQRAVVACTAASKRVTNAAPKHKRNHYGKAIEDHDEDARNGAKHARSNTIPTAMVIEDQQCTIFCKTSMKQVPNDVEIEQVDVNNVRREQPKIIGAKSGRAHI